MTTLVFQIATETAVSFPRICEKSRASQITSEQCRRELTFAISLKETGRKTNCGPTSAVANQGTGNKSV